MYGLSVQPKTATYPREFTGKQWRGAYEDDIEDTEEEDKYMFDTAEEL